MAFLAGILFMLAGAVFVIFNNAVRHSLDWHNERYLGDAWTGKYTRGGLWFVRGVIILVGLLLIYVGVGLILKGA